MPLSATKSRLQPPREPKGEEIPDNFEDSKGVVRVEGEKAGGGVSDPQGKDPKHQEQHIKSEAEAGSDGEAGRRRLLDSSEESQQINCQE